MTTRTAGQLLAGALSPAAASADVSRRRRFRALGLETPYLRPAQPGQARPDFIGTKALRQISPADPAANAVGNLLMPEA